jgi:hypothetical protein
MRVCTCKCTLFCFQPHRGTWTPFKYLPNPAWSLLSFNCVWLQLELSCDRQCANVTRGWCLIAHACGMSCCFQVSRSPYFCSLESPPGLPAFNVWLRLQPRAFGGDRLALQQKRRAACPRNFELKSSISLPLFAFFSCSTKRFETAHFREHDPDKNVVLP